MKTFGFQPSFMISRRHATALLIFSQRQLSPDFHIEDIFRRLLPRHFHAELIAEERQAALFRAMAITYAVRQVLRFSSPGLR